MPERRTVKEKEKEKDAETKICALKKRKIDDPKFKPAVSFPLEKEDVRLTSSSTSPNAPTQVPPKDAKSYNCDDQMLDFCKLLIVNFKSTVSEAAAYSASMAGEALTSSPVFIQNLGVLKDLASNPFPDYSDSGEAYKSILRIHNSALCTLQSICSGIPPQGAEDFHNNFLCIIIDRYILKIRVSSHPFLLPPTEPLFLLIQEPL